MDLSVDNQNGLMQLQIFTLDPFDLNKQVISDLLGMLPVTPPPVASWSAGATDHWCFAHFPVRLPAGWGGGVVANPPAADPTGVYFPMQTPIFVATPTCSYMYVHTNNSSKCCLKGFK